MAILKPEQYRKSSGPYMTKALFYEITNDQDSAVFTLKEQDYPITNTESPAYGKTMLSLRRLFVEYTLDDPTEVTFSDKVFGSWRAWSAICRSPVLAPYLEEWREEAAVRRKSLAFKSVVEEATGGRSALQASKYLIEEPWKLKGTRSDTKDGRALRKKIRETAAKAFDDAGIEEDIQRLKDQGLLQ